MAGQRPPLDFGAASRAALCSLTHPPFISAPPCPLVLSPVLQVLVPTPPSSARQPRGSRSKWALFPFPTVHSPFPLPSLRSFGATPGPGSALDSVPGVPGVPAAGLAAPCPTSAATPPLPSLFRCSRPPYAARILECFHHGALSPLRRRHRCRHQPPHPPAAHFARSCFSLSLPSQHCLSNILAALWPALRLLRADDSTFTSQPPHTSPWRAVCPQPLPFRPYPIKCPRFNKCTKAHTWILVQCEPFTLDLHPP